MSTADSYIGFGDTCCLHSHGSLKTASRLSIGTKICGIWVSHSGVPHDYSGTSLNMEAGSFFETSVNINRRDAISQICVFITPLRKPQISQLLLSSIFPFSLSLSLSLFLTLPLHSDRSCILPRIISIGGLTEVTSTATKANLTILC